MRQGRFCPCRGPEGHDRSVHRARRIDPQLLHRDLPHEASEASKALDRRARLVASGPWSKNKARLTGGPKARGELEIQFAVDEAIRIGARIFAGVQKILLSTNTQLVLPCWVSSTGRRTFFVVTRASSQAVMARQDNAAAVNRLFVVVVMNSSLEHFTLGPLYVGGAAAHQELLRLAGV